MNLKHLKIEGNKKIYRNLPVADLVEIAVKRGEGVLSSTGALVVHTGKYTGRSPKDRFIVRQKSVEDKINWSESNLPIEENVFDNLYNQMTDYLDEKELFMFDGFVGSMRKYGIGVRVISEYASQSLFANQLFLRPTSKELDNYEVDFKIICAPGFKARGSVDGVNSEAFIIINFDRKIVLIGGTLYSGEIKKSMFSIMNYLLPNQNVFPMHCSANIGVSGDAAVFFGLSGTGKTTLSSDPNRKLIGDDEHGWCDDGIFNFEGGCYAKTIRLSAQNEKEIYGAMKFGAVLENVVLNEDKTPNYDDESLTENTRGAYPLNYIDNIEVTGIGSQPNTIIFLTADAFGVLPPISKLSKEAAMYHFMSGYTSKLAGTERGITEPKATFSSCFGEPFMLMNPTVYAKLLGERIENNNVDVYLVNTGWSGGGYGVGKRIKLSYTRAMVTAALEGTLKDVSYVQDEIFNVQVPTSCPNVPSEILDAKNTWENKTEYYINAEKLVQKFRNNFEKFKDVPENIIKAGPNQDNIKSVGDDVVVNF